jgi:transposase
MTLKPNYHLLLYYWYIGMKSPRTITRKTDVALSTVTYNIKKLRQQGSLVHCGKNVRYSRITAEAARAIGQYIRSNCEVTAGQIAMKLETEKGIKVFIWIVQRYLRNAGYRNVLPSSKFMMTEEHRVRRLERANAHADDN